MEWTPTHGMKVISSAEYVSQFAGAPFVAGDLWQPNPHPFFRTHARRSLRASTKPATRNLFDRYACATFVLEDSISYLEAGTGVLHCYEPGDFTVIPAGGVRAPHRGAVLPHTGDQDSIERREDALPATQPGLPSREEPFEGDA
jgi:hypothetical protein